MKKLIIYAKKIYIVFIIMFFLIWNISFWQSDDLMYQVFEDAMQYWNVLKVWWKTSKNVWEEVLRSWIWISAWDSFKSACINPKNDEILYVYDNNERLIIDNESDCIAADWEWRPDWWDVNYKAPLIARVTKLLLSITMVLAITMIIFISLKLMINVLWWKDFKSSDFKKDITAIVVWVLLALFSVTIINLLRSVTNSSISTSNDDSDSKFWCSFVRHGVNQKMAGNEFKEFLCKNDTLWYEDTDLNGREYQYIKALSNWPDHMDHRSIWWYRCKVISWWDWKWVTINKAKNKCKNNYNWSWWLVN